MTRTIGTEFNDSLYTNPTPFITGEWIDESWHNDTCPSFVNKQLGIKLFVEADNVEDREDESYPRYTLYKLNSDGDTSDINVIFETENVYTLNKFLVDSCVYVVTERLKKDIHINGSKEVSQLISNIPTDILLKYLNSDVSEK